MYIYISLVYVYIYIYVDTYVLISIMYEDKACIYSRLLCF